MPIPSIFLPTNERHDLHLITENGWLYTHKVFRQINIQRHMSLVLLCLMIGGDR